MTIPHLPQEKLIDEKGQLTASWSLWFQQLVSVLQHQLSPQGLRVPQLATEIIKQLNKPNTIGALIYDSDTQQFKGNVNGSFKIFQLD